MSTLDKGTTTAIMNALRTGTVPGEGLEHFAVGLEPQMKALREQLDHVASGKRSAFKFIRGGYGSGKTFLASLLASEAMARGFVVTQVVISTSETPLHKLEQVYRKICQGLCASGRKTGMRPILDRWIYQLEEQAAEVGWT